MSAPALWSVDEMAAAMGAGRRGALPASISGISIDSRSIAAGEAFFAITGDRRDGHDFVAAALAAKAGLAVVAARHEQAGLFEQLTQAGDVVRESAVVEVQPLRGVGLADADDQPLRQCSGVGLVHTSPGKDVGAAHEIAVQVAPQHKNFVTMWCVTKRHHRCGRSWLKNFGHIANYPERGPAVDAIAGSTKFGA